MRAPPPEPLMMISGKSSRRGSLDEPRQPFADDRAHAPHDEGRIGHAKRHAAGANHAGAGEGRVAQAGPRLLGLEPFGVRFLVAKAERIGRRQVGVPLFERAFVEHPANAVAARSGTCDTRTAGRRSSAARLPCERSSRRSLRSEATAHRVRRAFHASFLPCRIGFGFAGGHGGGVRR